MKQGIINETNRDYHSYTEAISKSRLEKMSVCPQYFKWCEDNPKEPTADLIFGSAFHKWVLEKDMFYDEFVVSPKFDQRYKEQKEQAKIFKDEADAQGKKIINAEQFETIKAMKNAIMENRYAKRLLDGEHERSFYFEDDLTHEKCKARPDCYTIISKKRTQKVLDKEYEDYEYEEDLLTDDMYIEVEEEKKIVITDLKSCHSAITDDFMRDVIKYSYDLQAYMYSFGISKILDVPMDKIDFVFIAVEKQEPYLINVLQADKFILERGEALFRKYIGMYHECRETGNWYGLNGEYGIIEELHLPAYLMKEIDK